MMKRSCYVLEMSTLLLVFGLVLIGCETPTNNEIPGGKEAEGFNADHSGILAKTVDTVGLDDTEALTIAQAAYNDLSATAQGLLTAEKAKMDSLASKIGELGNTAAAEAFKTAHSDILAKTVDTVGLDDTEALESALTAYNALSSAAQSLLAAEKAKLESLEEQIATIPPRGSLAAALEEINALSGSPDNAYTLTPGDETMAAASLSNTNGPITITIDGSGRIVTLAKTGSLLTVGNNVTLVLTNITLRYLWTDYEKDYNTAPLVAVEDGGTLELGTGAHITRNLSRDPSGNRGGGVYVGSGGTFSMSGGKISSNHANANAYGNGGGGGGVYIGSGGTFTMNDGEISGNSGYYTTSGDKGGGGVYVGSGGTFTMNGGQISSNSSNGGYGSKGGGGVCVDQNGTFTMNGGKIADNTVYTYGSLGGGGVSVSQEGTFTMNNGEITGNKAVPRLRSTDASAGGGIYIDHDGTFTMSGGVISDNTASSNNTTVGARGGGVYVGFGSGTFAMDGGVILGNKLTGNNPFGAGVYVYKTFTMSGGASVNINNAVCLNIYSDFIIGGEFADPESFVARIDIDNRSVSGISYDNKRALNLASDYNGDLSVLKDRFILGLSGSVLQREFEINDNGMTQTRTKSSRITNIAHSDNGWILQSNGNYLAPTIARNATTRSRISFTTTGPDAVLRIELRVFGFTGEETKGNKIFIGALDASSPTLTNNYHVIDDNNIMRLNSATLNISVPAAGNHFVEVGFYKVGANNISNGATYKVIE
jgi:hypothetical protein